MPIFKTFNNQENILSNNSLFKKFMNEKYDIELIFNFYFKILSNDNKVLENHPLLIKRLMKLSEEYFIVKDKNNSNEKEITNTNNISQVPVKNILYKNLIPLDLSPENFLFMKYMKFHFGFIKFSQWYRPNQFNKLEVNENIMKDYLTKEMFLCMDKKKKDLKDQLKTMTDFQLISNVCIKERLTLYNFLIESNIKSKEAKDFINRIYMQKFRGKNYTPDFKKDIKNVNVDEIMSTYNKLKEKI